MPVLQSHVKCTTLTNKVLKGSLIALLLNLFGTCYTFASETISETIAIQNRVISTPQAPSFDKQTGLPTFLWIDSIRFKPQILSESDKKQQLETLSREVISELAENFRISDAALQAIQLTHIHDTGSGAIVVQLKQFFQGFELLQHKISIVYNRKLQAVSVSGFVAPNEPQLHLENPKFKSTQAISTAIFELTGETVPHSLWQQTHSNNISMVQKNRPAINLMQLPNDYVLKNVSLSSPVRTQSGWYLNAKSEVVAVTAVELEVARNSSVSHMFRYLVSSEQQIFEKTNLTSNATKTYQVWADDSGDKFPFAGPQGNSQFPHPTGEDDDTLIVITNPSSVTLDSATFSRLDPWLTAIQNTTSGNNVNAYVDISLPDGLTPFSADHQAAETSLGSFNYDYNFSADPNINTTLQNAAVVQAFYVTNYIHDWLYDAGFNEAAGNGQINNFGRGGAGGDPIFVEVQDFEKRNNASMSTPSDGSPARMQIYLWDGETSHQLEIDLPSTIAGIYETGAAAFGPTSFDVSQQLVLVDDGFINPEEVDATVHDACESPILNAVDLAGKIAVIDRGFCFFVEKVSRVETLGAIAVIIINQKTDGVITMGAGDDPPVINIPTLMLSKADGDPLRTLLLNGDNITSRLTRTTSVDRNAGLDNSLIAHEWGHFLNNRLMTVNNTQSEGLDEGWSDFLSLLFLTRAEDEANIDGVFTISAYANNRKNALFFGIRRVPYTTNTSINSLTFKHISDGEALPANNMILFGSDGSGNSEVHATGEIWAMMLWEGYVSLIKNPRHSFSEARNRMKNYMVAALKVTPAGANFVEARDSLLAVIQASDAADRQIFMDAFARRGLGIGAIAPAKSSETNQGVVESFTSNTIPPPAPPPTSSGGGGSSGILILLLLFTRKQLRQH